MPAFAFRSGVIGARSTDQYARRRRIIVACDNSSDVLSTLGRIGWNTKGAQKGAFEKYGGEEEDRTPDLRIANATLSQLSYFPENHLRILPKTTCMR